MTDTENQDTTSHSNKIDEKWERDVLNRLAFATINEQRRTRRWSIFFKLLGFAYLILLLFALKPDLGSDLLGDIEEKGSDKHTALVEINGVIAEDADANADNIISGLRSAFKDKDTAGVILRINSPGGSPVQSGYINDEIVRLREKYPDTPIYAVVADMCASGGYYIAAAADKIYADKASVVGSIGVLMNGFGFVNALDKLGIERRLMTAGENKGFLDPFSPFEEDDKVHIQAVLNNIHQQFIDVVKEGRGDRIDVDKNPELFSGLVWTGEQALELGLIDELGNSSSVAREVIEAEKIVNFTPEKNYFDRFAERLGTTLGGAIVQKLQLTNDVSLQ